MTTRERTSSTIINKRLIRNGEEADDNEIEWSKKDGDEGDGGERNADLAGGSLHEFMYKNP